MAKTKRKLTEFVRDFEMERRVKDCPVCKLPKEVREQIRLMRNRRIPVTVFCLWLKTEYGVTITANQLQTHGVGRHELRNAR